MLKPTRKLVTGGLLALAFVAVSLLAGGVSTWTPAALAQQGTVPPAPGNNDQDSDDNSQDNSDESSSQDNMSATAGGQPANQSADLGQSATQDTSGRVSSPEQPLPYTGQWQTIQPGEWQWFAFKYSFDSSRNSDDDESNDQVDANLRLDAEPVNGVSLTLVNREQVQAWQSGEKLEGFGAATPATYKVENKVDVEQFCRDYPDDPVCTGGDRSTTACENVRNTAPNPAECRYRVSQSRGYSNWKGTIDSTGTYYIVVRGDPRATGPIRYKFTFSGEGLTMK